MKMRVLTLIAVLCFGVAPASALAQGALCNSSLFSSIQSPINFASNIMAGLTPSTTTAKTSAATSTAQNTSTSTMTCVSPSPGGCLLYQVTTTGTGTGQATATGTDTTQTVTAGEQAQADTQKMLMQYEQAQMQLCDVSSLQGLSFSAWPGEMQQLSSQSTVISTLDPTPSVNVAASVYAQEAADATEIQQLEAAEANVTGTASAVQLQTEIATLQADQAQEAQMLQASQSIQQGQMQMYGVGLEASMFDLNSNGDPTAGFGFGN